MSESGDYQPAKEWKDQDFKSARAAYDTVIQTSLQNAIANNLGVEDCVPPEIETDAEAALCIVLDDTGSMGENAGKIRGHLGYVDHEMREYLGQDTKVSFACVGDAFCDRYPLQVKPFVNGIEMQKNLDDMTIEGGGGGNGGESYDIAAMYYARHCHMPNVIRKPILIFIGDEAIHEMWDKDAVQTWARCDNPKRMSTREIFDELKQKFSVYIIRLRYGNSTETNPSAEENRIHDQWVGLLGTDHVSVLPNAERVVDLIFAILAKETDRIEYFREELVDRQSKDKGGDKKIELALKAAQTLHSTGGVPQTTANTGGGHKSMTKGSGGPASISLLDDEDE